jgi:hypothetical protein
VVVAAPDGNAAGVSLFCFAVVTPGLRGLNGIPDDYEENLVKVQKDKCLGVYGCDEATIYRTHALGEQVEPHLVTGAQPLGRVANRDTFLGVWERVRRDRYYMRQDWTVKADPDAVFLPQRLRSQLARLKAPRRTPIYVRNTKTGFAGAIEVLSQMAVQTFLDNSVVCAKYFGDLTTEDRFLQACLDACGVGFMSDTGMLDDKLAAGTRHFRANDITPCGNSYSVAWHPYKDRLSWTACYEVATGTRKLTDFLSCNNTRRKRDVCSKASSLGYWDAIGNHKGAVDYYTY